ncbi:ATP-grasp domain-containing protein [Anatilimnocola floriformis]|uniref:ATP-grasp domain-containing protein n=1 Tax=Anatilimnocola floriformis TaxID=2948575 RepID=UPI0020C5249D|nr:ATP-grasp domain-containing protein [Anatilimnocola floriformis]
MERGPLIILGASVRAAAQWAIGAGYRPYAIDLFGDEDLRQLAETVKIERYPSEFLPALAAAPQAPWMYTGGLENYPRLIARLAKLRPLIGNGPNVLRKVRDPQWLAEFVRTTAVKYPQIGRREAGSEGREKEHGWLMKPLRSGGGMGIQRFVSPASRLAPPASRSSRHYYQQFISGQSCSASFRADEGRVRWIGATEQWIGFEHGAPQEFQYAGSLAPLELSAAEQAALLQMAERLAAATGMQGMFGCDFIRNAEGLWLIEVNPRYTASMELFARLRNDHQGKLIVYADRAGSCGESLRATMNSLHGSGVDVADIPCAGTCFEASQPICTLLVGGERATEVRHRLQAAAAKVRQTLDS